MMFLTRGQRGGKYSSWSCSNAPLGGLAGVADPLTLAAHRYLNGGTAIMAKKKTPAKGKSKTTPKGSKATQGKTARTGGKSATAKAKVAKGKAKASPARPASTGAVKKSTAKPKSNSAARVKATTKKTPAKGRSVPTKVAPTKKTAKPGRTTAASKGAAKRPVSSPASGRKTATSKPLPKKPAGKSTPAGSSTKGAVRPGAAKAGKGAGQRSADAKAARSAPKKGAAAGARETSTPKNAGHGKQMATKPVLPVDTGSSPNKPAEARTTPAKATKPSALPATRKERVQLEFQVRSSPNVLYELISTPSGFAEWYCNDVNVRGDQFTFIWDGEEEDTTLIGRKMGEVIRFRRNDDDDPQSYFEFRVKIDAMTNEVALIVTDHAWPDEVAETENLWNSQIAALIRVLGG